MLMWFFLMLASLSPAFPIFGPTTAQKPAAAKADIQTLKLNSKLMAREMPYRVILPLGHKTESKARYPVVYLLHGLTGHYTNWADKTALAEFAAKHNFVIVTPEGNNGWYTDSVSTPNDRYESYIVQELVPEIDKNFRTVADREHRFIAGLSMGGYGALKFGLKYPETFSLAGSFSGALGAASFTGANAGEIGKGIDAIYGPASSETRKTSDIFKMIREITSEKLASLPFIYQSCGTEDFLIQNNRDFLALMNEKKIPHEYREHPGGHTWIFWDDQVREFLDLAARRLK